MCAVKVRNAKLRNYLKREILTITLFKIDQVEPILLLMAKVEGDHAQNLLILNTFLTT
jgi:hypothetical protein